MSDDQETEQSNQTDRNSTETDSAKSQDRVNRRHQCQQCEKSFSHSAGLYNHMKKKHGLVVYAKASIVCKEPNCNFRCSMRDKLQAHLVIDHQKPLAFSTLKFSSIKEFEEWKEVFEKQEKCRFVKKSGTRIRLHTGEKHTYLYCSRSGTFVSNSKGKRTKMKKGTCKISNYCTASIDCIEQPNGTVIAKLCSTHYGHEPSVEFLRLTKSDKTVIADKLAQGIPRDVVIDNVRASVGEHLDRVHFLTMKDIRNIERSYGIKYDNKPKTGSEGFASVNDWVNDMDSLGDESPVIFYKRKNAPKILSDDSNCLEITDFCLVLMTKGQQEILKKFGQNGVFYLTWLSINNGYDLSLLTLMVADDLNEAFPVAYMVCTRTTREIEMLFFKVIRDKLGSFCARAIMTDDRKSLYDSWCSVMGFVPYHLLSNRYVDADWRDRLITVQNEDVQCAVYEVLYSYLSCTDSSKFEENLQAFIKHLKENSDTLVFGLYFEDNYLHRVRLWAGCYDKKSVGVNEHLNLDIIYNELLAVCNIKGKFSRLLDKTLQGLLTIVRDRQHNRILKITKQVQELSHHHGISKNINLDGIQAIENRKWQIKSESSNLLFTVTRKTYECSLKCALVCTECKMCAHMFECTCKVYNFDRTMCKHIHSVGRLFQKSLTVLDFWDSGTAANKNEPKDSLTYDVVKKDISVIKQLSALNETNSTNSTDKKETENSEVITQNKICITKANSSKVISVEEIVTMKTSGRNSALSNKVRSILQSIADGVCEVTDPLMLKKILSKLKKVKNFMEGNFHVATETKQTMKLQKRRGRPKKNPTPDEKGESVSIVKRKIGRPRKVKPESEQLGIGPRSLQEIAQEQLLEEQLLQQEDEDDEQIIDGAAKATDVNTTRNNAGEKSSVQETVTAKRRGRKPKLKTGSKSDGESVEAKRMKIDLTEDADDSARRKSKRNIKKKTFGNYEYFYKDETELKKKIDKSPSPSGTNNIKEANENKGKRGRPPKESTKPDNDVAETDKAEGSQKVKGKAEKIEESQTDESNESRHNEDTVENKSEDANNIPDDQSSKVSDVDPKVPEKDTPKSEHEEASEAVK